MTRSLASAPTGRRPLTRGEPVRGTTDGRAVQIAKAATPALAKTVAEAGVRRLTTATAGLREGPGLLVVGTKRGGTTFVWSTLLGHPQVMAMVPAAKHLKSSHYFYQHFDRGPEWYLGHFPTRLARSRHAARHGGALSLEASPFYLFDPRVAERAAAQLPQAKVVVLLRDPVERAFSHYLERCRAGVETLSFRDALRAEEGRLAGEEQRMADEPHYYSRPWDWYSYRTRGEYAGQVSRWFDALGRDRVLVLRSEDLYADADATLLRIQEFSGLTPTPLTGRKRNAVREREQIDAVSAYALQAHYATHNEELAELLDTPVWWS
ncbi:sulfotransferase [Nocardioides pacificus]